MTKKLLQINITANWGSHGKIAEGIGNVVMSHGWESHVAYGRWANPSSSQLYHIGSMMDERIHGVGSRLFDNHGLMSKRATIQLLNYVEQLNPDIIHLHNIHGYYLNYPELFSFLSQANKPVVWTLHDCWPYTGHCAHYMYLQCDRWKTHCEFCPQKRSYPASLLLDCSYRNYDMKKQAFLSVPNLTLVPVSKWLEGDLRQSFLKDCRIQQIYNGIDINVFKPQTDTKAIMEKYNIPSGKRVLLGVASNWWRKGFEDFLQLRRLLDDRYVIVLVGLDEKQRTYLSGEEKKAEIMQECMSELNIPGETILADRNLKLRCKILEKPKNLSIKDIPQKIYTKWFDYGIIKSSLYIRTRQAGDTIVIDGGTARVRKQI